MGVLSKLAGPYMNWDFQYWTTLTEQQQSAFLASYAGALHSGYQWSKTTITYSFPSTATGEEYLPYVPAGETFRFNPLDAQEKAYVRFFFDYIESFLNLDFREVPGAGGDIVLGHHNMTPAGYADLPGNFGKSGVFLDSGLESGEYGDFAYTVLTHEIGHVLGLDHSRAYDGEARSNPNFPVQFDTSLLTIMTYSDMVDLSSDKFVSALMPLDIAALMQMYGARASTENNVFRVVDGYAMPSHSGNTWTISGKMPFTLVDTGGFDVLDASGYTATAGVQFVFDEGLWVSPQNPFNQLSYYINSQDRPWIDLTGQTDVVPMIGIFQSTVIEKFIGSGGDDHVFGAAGNQIVDGRGGIDVFYLSGTAGGYDFSLDSASGEVVVVDLNLSDGNDGTDRLVNIDLIGFADQSLVTVESLLDPVIWYESRDDVMTVAATWQLMMGNVPLRQGFEYLISSPANATDLNDPYYAAFNTENIYLNFACSLAFETARSAAWYEAEYGSLSYGQAVSKAVDTIITATGTTDLAGAKSFFLGAQSFYTQVALERIVRPGVDLEDAVKVAMLSSVLYESVKADAGPYGEAVNDFATDVRLSGLSDSFGESLFA